MLHGHSAFVCTCMHVYVSNYPYGNAIITSMFPVAVALLACVVPVRGEHGLACGEDGYVCSNTKSVVARKGREYWWEVHRQWVPVRLIRQLESDDRHSQSLGLD